MSYTRVCKWVNYPLSSCVLFLNRWNREDGETVQRQFTQKTIIIIFLLVVPNPHDFIASTKYKRRSFECLHSSFLTAPSVLARHCVFLDMHKWDWSHGEAFKSVVLCHLRFRIRNLGLPWRNHWRSTRQDLSKKKNQPTRVMVSTSMLNTVKYTLLYLTHIESCFTYWFTSLLCFLLGQLMQVEERGKAQCPGRCTKCTSRL